MPDQRRHTDGERVHEKMLCITSPGKDANQHKIQPHTYRRVRVQIAGNATEWQCSLHAGEAHRGEPRWKGPLGAFLQTYSHHLSLPWGPWQLPKESGNLYLPQNMHVEGQSTDGHGLWNQNFHWKYSSVRIGCNQMMQLY